MTDEERRLLQDLVYKTFPIGQNNNKDRWALLRTIRTLYYRTNGRSPSTNGSRF